MVLLKPNSQLRFVISLHYPLLSPFWCVSWVKASCLCCAGTDAARRVLQGAGCRWWGVAWWCAATPRPARVAAPPAATTTSPYSCRQRCAPLNLPPRHPSTAAPEPSSLLPLPHPSTSTWSDPSPHRPRPALSISIAPLAHSGKAGSASILLSLPRLRWWYLSEYRLV